MKKLETLFMLIALYLCGVFVGFDLAIRLL